MNSSHALAPTILCASRSERRQAMADEFHSRMREESLATNRFLALTGKALTLFCLEGELWLTGDGDAEDHIIGAGQCFPIQRRQQVTVQALRPSRVRLVEA